jgi:Protein of unknown function (DUF1566)
MISRKTIGVMGLILGLCVLGVAAVAQAGSLEPSAVPGPTMRTLEDLTPAWDQVLPASERFKLVMGGAAVLDKETGLVWERSPSQSYVWSESQFYCNNILSIGNRKGWRLPTVQELASLVDLAVTSSPRLPSGNPFSNVQSSDYWSATTFAGITTLAWGVSFVNGAVDNGLDKGTSQPIWCVRGGQGVDPQ